MVFQPRSRQLAPSPTWQSIGAITLMSLLLLHLTSHSASAGLKGLPTSPAGGAIVDVLIADVSGDGKGDAVALIFGSTSVWVYLGNGDGTFGAGVGYLLGNLPTDVQTLDGSRDRLTLADLNGDSRLDLIVSTPGVTYFKVLLATGGGTFGPQTTYPTGGFIVSGKVEVGRVNGDAIPDLIVSGNTITLYTGNGDGTFTAAPALNLGFGFARLGDLNSDGKLDLVAIQNNWDLNVYLGNGAGTFTLADTHTGPYLAVAAELADLNGDGKLDVAVGSAAIDSVFLYLGQGNGQVVRQEDTEPHGRVFGRIVVSDVNGDGKPDIVASCCTGNPPIGSPGTVFVLLGVGDGTFAALVNFLTVPSDDMTVGHLNGDALPDILVGDVVDGTLVALLNDGPATVQFASAAATVTENAGTTPLTLNRTGGNGPISVIVNASGGNATQGADYTFAAPQTVTWSAGDFAPKTVQVPILQDQIADGTKTVQFGLSLPAVPTWGVWGTLGAQTSTTVTMTDDEAPPAVSIANVSVTEGNGGTKLAQFPVTLSGVATTQTITVAYATTNVSATAGSDYTATSGTLTFPPGTTSRTIDVPIVGDSGVEPDETFTVTLSNPTNATLGNGQAIGIIQNDDSAPPVGPAPACTPRPRVVTLAAAGGGALQVTIQATPLNTSASNPLREIRFGTFQNATVTLNGEAVTSGQSVTLPAGVALAELTVRRVAPGQPTTVPLTIVDGCGEWQTFVGGGALAGF